MVFFILLKSLTSLRLSTDSIISFYVKKLTVKVKIRHPKSV